MKNSDRTKTIISHGDYKIDFYESNEDDRMIRTFSLLTNFVKR